MKKKSVFPLVFITCISFILILWLTLFFLILYRSKHTQPAKDPLIGAWHRSIDLSDDFRHTARAWLSDARLGDTLYISDYLTELPVEVSLEFKEDKTYTQSIDESSYQAAQSTAEEALEEAFAALLSKRGKEAGKLPVSREEADALILQATGQSFSDYLNDHNITLLPPLSQLQKQYDAAGVFRVTDNLLERESLSPAALLCDGETLVLRPETEYGEETEPEVYVR